MPKGVGAGRNRKIKYHNIAQYFAIEKAHRCGNHYERGWELRVCGTGREKFRPLCPPHSPDMQSS